MSGTLDTNNRLRKAVNSVPVPAYLAARVRGEIGAELPIEASTRNFLKRAVQSEPVPPFLEARIRDRIRAGRRGRGWMPKLIPATAALAILIGLGTSYHLGHLRLTVHSQESYIASTSSRVATLMRVGLGDHIHCAVFRKYPKKPPTTEEFIQKLTPQYAGLLPLVRTAVPDSYRMMLAHQCRYRGRRFVHLSLMNDSNLLSLVIARKGGGESFNTENMLPALVQSDIPMYQADIQRFQISAFETRDYLVYFISDLPKEQNTEMMLTLGPSVKGFLSELEL